LKAAKTAATTRVVAIVKIVVEKRNLLLFVVPSNKHVAFFSKHSSM
jgi:hypothetical protein